MVRARLIVGNPFENRMFYVDDVVAAQLRSAVRDGRGFTLLFQNGETLTVPPRSAMVEMRPPAVNEDTKTANRAVVILSEDESPEGFQRGA